MEIQKPKETPAELIIRNVQERLGEHDGVFVIALDGKSGTGKTTIAKEVAEKLDGVNVLCDDFFTGGKNEYWATKTDQQKNDEVIDWQRIKREVIDPLKAGRQALWHPFNWKNFEGLSPKTITAEPKRVVILDGAYSSREELSDVIDYSVLVTVPDDEARVKRVIEREGEDYSDDWHRTWQQAMDYYFDKVRPPESFDLVVES